MTAAAKPLTRLQRRRALTDRDIQIDNIARFGQCLVWLKEAKIEADGQWTAPIICRTVEEYDALHLPGSTLRGKAKGGEAGPADPEAKRRHGEALAFIAGYTGTFGLILSLQADRRFGTKHMRLSERQVEAVLAARDRDQARQVLAEVAVDEYAAAQYAARSVAPVASERTVEAVVGHPIPAADGMYRHNGVVYKVQTAVNGSGHRYAKVLDTDRHAFIYTPGAINRLSPSDRMTVDEAAAFGQLYGWCCVCGRTLTDEKSIAAGIGPICAGKV